MPGLSFNELALLSVAAITLTLLLSGWLRPDLVALLTLLVLGTSGIIAPEQALAGFSRPAVITIAGLFVITAALERTGAVQWLGERLAALGGGREARLVAVFMVAGACLSLVMNNIAAGAVLLPAAVNVARRAHVPPSKILMPLAFATLLGGMATLFTTANIVLSGNLEAQGLRGLTMLDFLPTGGIVALAGLAYLLLVGRRLLPQRESVSQLAPSADLAATYALAERLWEVQVQPGSPLAGRLLAETVIGARLGLTVLAIRRGGESLIAPEPSARIAVADTLLVLGREERVRQLEADRLVIGQNAHGDALVRALPVNLAEVVIGPRSPAIGATLKSLRFRTRYGLSALALWRAGRSYRTDVGDFALQAGDALLMVGPANRVEELVDEPGYILLVRQEPERRQLSRRALLAVLITALVLLLAAFQLLPTAEAMLAGAVALILSGCLTMEEAYRAIEWRVVVLIAGLLPVGTGLIETGLASRIGQLVGLVPGFAGALGLIAALYLAALLLTQVVGGQVAALVIGPVAVSAAVQLGVNPQAAAVAVAIACSAAFLTPIAHPVNLLMMGPGGYTAGDFFRAGLGLALVTTVTLLLVLPLLWGL